MNEEQIIAAERAAQERLAAAKEEYARASAPLRAEVGALIRAARGDHSGPQTAALVGLAAQVLNEMEHGEKSRYSVERALEILAAVRSLDWSVIPAVKVGRPKYRRNPR